MNSKSDKLLRRRILARLREFEGKILDVRPTSYALGANPSKKGGGLDLLIKGTVSGPWEKIGYCRIPELGKFFVDAPETALRLLQLCQILLLRNSDARSCVCCGRALAPRERSKRSIRPKKQLQLLEEWEIDAGGWQRVAKEMKKAKKARG